MNRTRFRKSNGLIYTKGQSHRRQDISRTVDTQMSPNETGIPGMSNQPHVLGHNVVPVKTGSMSRDSKGGAPCGRI